MTSLLVVILLFAIFYLILVKEEPKVIYIEKKVKHRDHHDPMIHINGGRLRPKDALSGRRMTH